MRYVLSILAINLTINIDSSALKSLFRKNRLLKFNLNSKIYCGDSFAMLINLFSKF